MARQLSLVWHDRDLRIADNPALSRAGEYVLPVYIYAPQEHGKWPLGGASQWWLARSLKALSERYAERGATLLQRRGSSLASLQQLIKQHKVTQVLWNERSEPTLKARDTEIARQLRAEGVEVEIVPDARLCDPEQMLTGTGRPYSVFTPYYNTYLRLDEFHEQVPEPRQLRSPIKVDESPATAFEQRPVQWASGWSELWTPGEIGAQQNLEDFGKVYARYAEQRDYLASVGTSHLSPHLAFGEISARQVFQWLKRRWKSREDCPVLRQLIWREFARHFVHYFPQVCDEPWREEYARFSWEPDAKKLKVWQQGLTGYPIVDAGMRQLWQTGWMHNRARMVVGSFLVKDLLIPWQEGARWFWDTLVDADLCNNSFGWQWVAGSGADAAPFFRIFNPSLQGERFDPDGEYVKRWIPELSCLPSKYIHKPWEAPQLLRTALDYPKPMVDHKRAREKALAAFKRLNR